MTLSTPPQLIPQDARDLSPLWSWLAQIGVDARSIELIQQQTASALDLSVDSRLTEWREAMSALAVHELNLQSNADLQTLELGPARLKLHGVWSEPSDVTETLQRLHPWRKGPIHLGDILIDTEWRSDWKWDRVAPHLSLGGARVLDIGCGNGYHCWRALGEGAQAVLGVDPTRLFHYQHRAISQTLARGATAPLPVHHLPLTLESLDDTPLPHFDVILSMGVLYHRRDPHAHLRSLQSHFSPSGGELLLETLITPDDQPLYPAGRYAQMRNVWCLPDRETLVTWLSEAGYCDVKVVDLNRTTLQEQRQTDWMRFHSLQQALDPQDERRTIEGHPAPLRAAVHAHFQP